MRPAPAVALALAAVTATVGAAHGAAAAPAARAPHGDVAVVVDFGARSHRHPRVLRRCVPATAGMSGADAVAALTAALRVPAPTYGSSGLLCSIAGYPASGCGTVVPGGYDYWSYWHGGRAWHTADVGPAEFGVAAGDVEGWRFEDPGTGGPGDPPPSGPSSYAAVCEASQSAPSGATSSPGPSSTELASLAAAVVVFVALVALAARRRRAEPA